MKKPDENNDKAIIKSGQNDLSRPHSDLIRRGLEEFIQQHYPNTVDEKRKLVVRLLCNNCDEILQFGLEELSSWLHECDATCPACGNVPHNAFGTDYTFLQIGYLSEE